MIFKITSITAALFLIFACATPQRKLNRLLEKHPELKHTETIIVRDTIRDTIRVVSPGIEIIDGFDFSKLIDTVYLDTNQLHIKIWTNKAKDSVFIQGKCDTVFINVPIEIPVAIPVNVETIMYRKPRDNLRWFIYGFGAASLLWIFFDKYKRKDAS